MNLSSENARIHDPRQSYGQHTVQSSAAGPYWQQYAAYGPQPPNPWWGFANPAVQSTPQPSQPQIKFHNTFGPQSQNISSRTPLVTQQPPQASTNPSAASNSTNARKRSSASNTNGRPASKRPRRSNIENVPPSNLSNPSQTSSTTVRLTETGPFTSPAGASTHQHPAFTAFTSILPKDKKNTKVATDVWFFMKRVNQMHKPSVVINPVEEPLLLKRPKESECSHLACRLCT
jgi:hypothetical protein